MLYFGQRLIDGDLELGNKCSILRGILQDSVKGDDVKIDDQSYVAHNINVGRGSLRMSGYRLNSRVMVGKFTWTGTGSVLKEDISVCDNVIIGISSCFPNDVFCNATVAGNSSRGINK